MASIFYPTGGGGTRGPLQQGLVDSLGDLGHQLDVQTLVQQLRLLNSVRHVRHDGVFLFGAWQLGNFAVIDGSMLEKLSESSLGPRTLRVSPDLRSSVYSACSSCRTSGTLGKTPILRSSWCLPPEAQQAFAAKRVAGWTPGPRFGGSGEDPDRVFCVPLPNGELVHALPYCFLCYETQCAARCISTGAREGVCVVAPQWLPLGTWCHQLGHCTMPFLWTGGPRLAEMLADQTGSRSRGHVVLVNLAPFQNAVYDLSGVPPPCTCLLPHPEVDSSTAPWPFALRPLPVFLTKEVALRANIQEVSQWLQARVLLFELGSVQRTLRSQQEIERPPSAEQLGAITSILETLEEELGEDLLSEISTGVGAEEARLDAERSTVTAATIAEVLQQPSFPDVHFHLGNSTATGGSPQVPPMPPARAPPSAPDTPPEHGSRPPEGVTKVVRDSKGGARVVHDLRNSGANEASRTPRSSELGDAIPREHLGARLGTRATEPHGLPVLPGWEDRGSASPARCVSLFPRVRPWFSRRWRL